MRPKQDLTGQVFGNWTVLAFVQYKGKIPSWHCRCHCGVERDLQGPALKGGRTKSCGCRVVFSPVPPEPAAGVGKRFGHWTILALGHYDLKQRAWHWLCRCDCGREKEVAQPSLTHGHSQSCGCKQREGATFKGSATPDKITHKGATHTVAEWAAILGLRVKALRLRISRGWSLERALSPPERGKKSVETLAERRLYAIWNAMIHRCRNEKDKNYPTYGGRGIRVHERWLTFPAFREDVSSLPHFGEPGRSIDRIDNDGPYEPGNVRWSTYAEQAANTRPNPRNGRRPNSPPS
jgi:hypothetical protein